MHLERAYGGNDHDGQPILKPKRMAFENTIAIAREVRAPAIVDPDHFFFAW